MRVAFAVGAMRGVPFEVWALFASESEARRYADQAAYLFDVFALPVYDRYGETPPALRPNAMSQLSTYGRAANDESGLAVEALDAGEALALDAGPVYAVGDFESTGLPEVRLLFATEPDAQHYLDVALASGLGGQSMEVMPAYQTYDDCPPRSRYTEAGPALSQLIRPR